MADGGILFRAFEFRDFEEFYGENYSYPNATSTPFFNLGTFESLRSMDLYQGNMLPRLKNNQADAYDSPDDQGSNQEFWVLVTVRIDPSYQVVIASSDNAPLGDGSWMEGVFTFKDGELVAGPGVTAGG